MRTYLKLFFSVGTSAFRRFLIKCSNPHDLDFWNDCEKLKDNQSENSKETIRIANFYLQPTSKHQVNNKQDCLFERNFVWRHYDRL